LTLLNPVLFYYKKLPQYNSPLKKTCGFILKKVC
jgi:hypothetical protein